MSSWCGAPGGGITGLAGIGLGLASHSVTFGYAHRDGSATCTTGMYVTGLVAARLGLIAGSGWGVLRTRLGGSAGAHRPHCVPSARGILRRSPAMRMAYPAICGRLAKLAVEI